MKTSALKVLVAMVAAGALSESADALKQSKQIPDWARPAAVGAMAGALYWLRSPRESAARKEEKE